MNNRTSPDLNVTPRAPGRLLKLLLGAALCSYVGLVVLLTLLESSMMYPAPSVEAGNWAPSNLNYEDAEFASADGTALHGWFVPAENPKGVVLFSHGNGEHVAWQAQELAFIRDAYGVSVMAWDYRGYGKSQGKPSEQGILADAEAARTWLANRAGVPEESIILFGRSLGGAVAVHLAATGGARALVLDRTFSSMVDVASKHFPWLPIRTMLSNRYPSAERIANYSGPLIQIHGRPDRVVPFETGRALFDASPSPNKRFLESDTLGHNDPWPEEYFIEVRDFIGALN